MAPRPLDRPQRSDPEDQRQLAVHRRHAVALHVVTRFREQPTVAREMLDMLGVLGPSEYEPPMPGPPPDDQRITPRRRSR